MNPIYNNAQDIIYTTHCQVCKSLLSEPILDLGQQPMCDDLIPINDIRSAEKFPVKISICTNCQTGHQTYNIKKEKLFPDDYHYRPRFTQDVLDGMNSLVEECQDMFGDLKGKVVCDVGCNDGSLLDFFKKKGTVTCGIEPTGAADDASGNEHIIVKSYFDKNSVDILLSKAEKPDIVTFTNVFAHIENLDDTIDALKELIHDNTVIVIENHYFGTVLKTMQFDTFYHEHPRTYGLTSFKFIADRLGVRILSVKFPKRYGGNIRVIMGKDALSQNDLSPLDKILEEEKSFSEELVNMNLFVGQWVEQANDTLDSYKKTSKKVYGKSFPGRASILINLIQIDENIQPMVFEKDSSLKVGHYVPGTKIPIVSDSLWRDGIVLPNEILIWGWHIGDEIAHYMRNSKFNGKLLLPLPKFGSII